MSEIVIVYESWSGNVAVMAEAVAKGVAIGGMIPVLQPVKDADHDRITRSAGLILGSFTSYGQMAGGIKSFLDRSPHGKWKNKAGGAFASSGIAGGGCETTVLSLINALLVHGCVVRGDTDGPHFGPVCTGTPDVFTLEFCQRLGERVAKLAGTISAHSAELV